MNSVPVQLLSLGGQLNVLGAGVRPPGTDDTAAGGDAFSGLLQQLLLGSSVQMPVVAPDTSPENGTPGSEGSGSGGEISPEGALAVLAASEAVTDLMSSQPAGGSVQSVGSPGTSAEGPPGQLLPLPVPQVSVEETDPATVLQSTIERPIELTPVLSDSEKVLELMTPVPDRQPVAPEVRITRPVVTTTELVDPEVVIPVPGVKEVAPPETKADDRDVELPSPDHAVRQGKTANESRPVRRAGTLVSTPDISAKVPVSSKEGDKVPVRAQETAPVPGEEMPGSEDLRRMVRVLQHVPDSIGASATDNAAGSVRTVRAATAPVETPSDETVSANGREQDGAGLKAVPAATSSAQENGVRDGMQHHEPIFTPPATPLTKIDGSRAVEMSARATETFATLPPETAQSVVDQVVKHLAMQVNGENSEVRITLQPESLGEVTVHVKMEGGKMQAQIDVSQASVKSALEMQLPQLRHSLSERGIDVQRLDVSFGGDHPTRESGGGHEDRKQRQGSRRMFTVDAVEQYDTGRLMGYNTMEMVM